MSGPMPAVSTATFGAPIRKATLADDGGLIRRALSTLATWHARSRERAALAAMDARTLRDLGLARADIVREVEKPFWRA